MPWSNDVIILYSKYYFFLKRDEREPRAEKHANEMEPAAAAQRELSLTRQPTRPHTKIFRPAG